MIGGTVPRANHKNQLSARALAKHKKRFLRFFPDAFRDERYIAWERTYKWESHKLWDRLLNKDEYKSLLRKGDFEEIANRALQVESKTKPPFLFSFEKMALRDALRTPHGARLFAEGLHTLLYERGPLKDRFVEWIVAVADLPRKQSRVLSWPILTFYPFIAQPAKYMILKPTAMVTAAAELRYDFQYSSKPSYTTYQSLLDFANLVKEEIADLRPRDYHDVQTFLWVIGSAEYESIEQDL
jgi:hypothetical protein